MHWLRFAAIWVYCLGTIVVPGLHHALHQAAHTHEAAGCHGHVCAGHGGNPFAARKAKKSEPKPDAKPMDARSVSIDYLASNAQVELRGGLTDHRCSDTCVVCLATSVLGHSLGIGQPSTVVSVCQSSLPIIDQNRCGQVCANESVPRGPPSASSEFFV